MILYTSLHIEPKHVARVTEDGETVLTLNYRLPGC